MTDVFSWARAQVHQAAETIGYDLEDVPEEERAAVLADFAGDLIYRATGKEAEAFRLLKPAVQVHTITVAAREWSL